jgi:hypothetical protein
MVQIFAAIEGRIVGMGVPLNCKKLDMGEARA